jgi:hypothetical protein
MIVDTIFIDHMILLSEEDCKPRAWFPFEQVGDQGQLATKDSRDDIRGLI